MYGTHTLAFQRIFVRMKIISISIRFSYVSLIRNSVTGPLHNIVNKDRQVHSIASVCRATLVRQNLLDI